MVKLLDGLVGPVLQDPEVHHQAFAVEALRRHGHFDGEIVSVEFFAFPADLLQGMGGGKGAFNRHFVHAFFNPRFHLNSFRIWVVHCYLPPDGVA